MSCSSSGHQMSSSGHQMPSSGHQMSSSGHQIPTGHSSRAINAGPTRVLRRTQARPRLPPLEPATPPRVQTGQPEHPCPSDTRAYSSTLTVYLPYMVIPSVFGRSRRCRWCHSRRRPSTSSSSSRPSSMRITRTFARDSR